MVLGGCSVMNSYHFCASCFPRVFRKTDQDSKDGDDIAEVRGSVVSVPPKEVPRKISPDIHRDFLKNEAAKSRYFSQDFPDDVYFRERKWEMLQSVVQKFRDVQKQVGFGNFNLVGMDEFFFYSGRSSRVAPVTSEEKKFLEELFFVPAKTYGFNGDKVFKNFTDRIQLKDAFKVPYTGHYLRKGDSLVHYEQIKKDVGPSLILTSGLRGMAKQFHLFLEKGLETKGNMSKASRSLAPPGYSFHGLGDFDVGKVGYGIRNFTDGFAQTKEYQDLIELGYVDIRYTESNLLGVRFEPWHIKVKV